MTHDLPKATITDVIRVYLPLFIAVVGAAVTWGVFTTKITANEERINSVEIKQEGITSTLTDLRISVGKIEQGVLFIQKQYK